MTNVSMPMDLDAMVTAFLAEDIGRGDLTSQACVSADAPGVGQLEFREAAVVCGLPIIKSVFTQLDPGARIDLFVQEGAILDKPMTVARIRTTARALLTGERVMLNLIGRLSGVASLTRAYLLALEGTNAKLLDTRKTTPGLRSLQKYAVRVGGGSNHRRGLDDGVLIKDNHLALAGGVKNAVSKAKAITPPGIRIEVEVENISQLEEALEAGADMILLDNMGLVMLREAVKITNKRALLEASGGITLATLRDVALTGVDYISAGALTHSAPNIDVALEVVL